MIDLFLWKVYILYIYIYLYYPYIHGERKREIYFQELSHAIRERLASPKSVGRLAEAAFNHRKTSGSNYYNGQQSQSSHQSSLTHRNLWNWLIEHGAPRSEIDSLLNSYLYKLKKSSRSREQKYNLNCRNRKSWPPSQFPYLSQFTDQNPLRKGKAGSQ